jgi:hypothetical protein
MPKSPPLYKGRKLTCGDFPESFLKKYGWDSCISCSLDRVVPDRLRKHDLRRCCRSRDNNLIKVKIHCDSKESLPHGAAITPECDKENDPNGSGDAAVAVSHDSQHVSRDYKKQSKKWWNEHNEFITKLKAENAEASRTVILLKEENKKHRNENEQLQNVVKQLSSELFATKAQLIKAKEKIDGYNTVMPKIHKETRKPELFAMIGAVLAAVLNIIMRKTQQITRLCAVSQVIFEKELFGSMPTERVLRNYSKMYCRRYIYLPWKVLQALDTSINGGINYTGLESLRKVEGLREYERGFLPSRSAVQRCAAELHALGQEVVPVKKVESVLGEMFQFDYEKVVRHILRAFSLHEIAQRESVELCITLDGAELTKDLCHLTFGIKVTDSRAIDPRDGSPLSYSEDGVFGNLFRVQSRNYCFILKSLLGKDSKKASAEFKDVFKFFDNLMAHGLPENENGP